MIDYSIEYAHVYDNEEFRDEHAQSIYQLNRIFPEYVRGEVSHQLLVMIDDYSPKEHTLNHLEFIAKLRNAGAIPDMVIKESDLIETNHRVLDLINKRKIRRSLDSYIKTSGKYPCSLFVASWYLARLGVIDSIPFIKPAHKIVNILPTRFREPERKALKIIESCVPNEIMIDRILNIYLPVTRFIGFINPNHEDIQEAERL